MGISMKTTSAKLLASGALIATAAAVAGLGTYGGFTSSTTASQQVKSGTVGISLADSGTNSLNIPIVGVLPGDRIERLVSLVNTGDSDLNAVTLSTTATAPVGGTASPLTTDVKNGLQMTIESCSVPWSGTAAPYSCSGTSTTVLATGPIIGANRTLASLTALTAGNKDNLKVSATLPASAPNTFQGAIDTIGFAFTATQRTATVK